MLASIAPAQRCVNRTPSSCGKVVRKWLARRSNVSGRSSYSGRTFRPGVVHRVVAAEQDAAVGAEPVVVELVGQVAHALAVAPAELGQPVVAERLGHEHVVVHRHRHEPVPLQQRREHVRREHGAVGAHHATVGDDLDARPGVVDAAHRGALVHDHARLDDDAGELEGQLRGMQDRVRAAVPPAREVGGRRELGAHRRLVEEDVVPVVGIGSGDPRHLVAARPPPPACRCARSPRPCGSGARSPRCRRGSPARAA